MLASKGFGRPIVVAALAVALTVPSFGAYTARLYFRDDTNGQSGPGAVQCRPGDLISLRYSFHRDDLVSRWDILQLGSDIYPPGPSRVLTDSDALRWDSALRGHPILGDIKKFPTVVAWDPADTDGNLGEITGAIYDNAVDPGDNTHSLVTMKGVYALIGVASTATESHDIDLRFFDFTVGSAALDGDELHWLYEGREIDNGIATRVYINGGWAKASDNWLTVVPEPGSIAAILAGLASLVALRRRR